MKRFLAEEPPEIFIKTLRERGVPVSIGRSIVATWHPHENAVLQVIQELGLELHVIFNKGAVMVLPTTVNKATGLLAALKNLLLSPHNLVGIGDAENDHAFLAACECSVAVANALPSLKERADVVTKLDHGAGVEEIIEELLRDDLARVSEKIDRHGVLLGHHENDNEVRVPEFGPCILVAGPSGSGKSASVTALLERLCDQQYQFCVIDPEGDYEGFLDSVVVGGAKNPPPTAEIETLLQQGKNTVINLLGIPFDDRPAKFAELMPVIQKMRAATGRPHWIAIDELHHLLPASWIASENLSEETFQSTIMITVHPDHVSPRVLGCVDTVIAVGAQPLETIPTFCRASGRQVPGMTRQELQYGEVLYWPLRDDELPKIVRVQPAVIEKLRHRRKYAEGDLKNKSFYFRGPDGKLNLKAQNLAIFLQMADGIDDDTWNFHLKQHDYSQWVKDAVKDEDLAQSIAEVEHAGLSPEESRRRLRELISEKYTEAA